MKTKKLLYAILKEVEKGNCTFSTEDFWLEREELFDVLRLADLENYLINITYADNIPNFFDMMDVAASP